MKKYIRLMLGRKSIHADECLNGGFVGVDFQIHQDLSKHFKEDWREFNKFLIPIYLQIHPEKKKVTAGLACATIWVVSYNLKNGDILLCSNGSGSYMIGEIAGDYYYKHGEILPHRRAVKWYPNLIERSSMSEGLRNSTGAIATYCVIDKHAVEIESLIGGNRPATIISTDETIEDPSEFAMEKHLEDFLVKNWKQTELGKNYDVYEEDGEIIGRQFPSDTGPIDILAISKDKKSLLVIELKKGRASDHVVGQIQRYMGYVKDELAEANQQVKGIIIAHEDDLRIKRALSVANNIEFYRFQVSFKLIKG